MRPRPQREIAVHGERAIFAAITHPCYRSLNMHPRRDQELAAAAIHDRWQQQPRAGIILGTGLGQLAEEVEADAIIDYTDIPGFGKSTALAHKGRLICGQLEGKPVVVMQGRVHLYEGYSPQQVALPVRVMKALGAELLIVTNANGGVNPKFSTGDIVVMDDHINLMWTNPLIGPNDDDLGPRFPDMCSPYDEALIDSALAIARKENFTAHRGVYAAMTGPSYETRAEYRMLRKLGADCVGMSTVPEALAAVHGGMRVLGLSIVTNVANPDIFEKVDAEEVLVDAAAVGGNVAKIIRGVLADI